MHKQSILAVISLFFFNMNIAQANESLTWLNETQPEVLRVAYWNQCTKDNECSTDYKCCHSKNGARCLKVDACLAPIR